MRWWRKMWCASGWLAVLLVSAEGCGPTEGMGEPSKAAHARQRIMEMPVEEPVALPEAEPLEESELPGTLRPRGLTWAFAEGAEAEAPEVEEEEVETPSGRETEAPLAEEEPAPGSEAAIPEVEGEAEPVPAEDAEEAFAEEEPAAGGWNLE